MKLTALSKKTEYPVVIRKFITTHILRFRTDITKAIKHRLNEKTSVQQKITGKYPIYLLYFIYLLRIGL